MLVSNEHLSPEHLSRVCLIYEVLCESNPSLSDLPKNPLWIRWRYLPYDRWRCYGEAQESDIGPMLSINPHAFDDGWADVLVGIINHEMVHLAHPYLGHEDPFKDYEMGWPGYRAWRVSLEQFRSHTEREAYYRTIVHVYSCPSCERVVKTDQELPPGSACKHCCMEHNRGNISPHYSLIYVGREGLDNGGNTDTQT